MAYQQSIDKWSELSAPPDTYGLEPMQSKRSSPPNLTVEERKSYVDQPGSVYLNLTHATATSAVLRVDTSIVDSTTGRRSVRIQSKSRYDKGLFVFDILHTPYGCSLWPALWLVGANWPEQGEIDVVEAANSASVGNTVTLHTTNGCSMENINRKQVGRTINEDCYNGTDSNAGCGVRGPASSYGAPFNAVGGGVYALEVRDEGIRVWQFPRSAIPVDVADVVNKVGPPGHSVPDPSTWGQALADFPSTACAIGQHFRNMSIVANIDICGQWAGVEKFYTLESGCPGTCVNYVSTQPGSTYDQGYWEFGGWWVFRARAE